MIGKDVFIHSRQSGWGRNHFFSPCMKAFPRHGPGSTACTKKMFSFLPGLPEKPEILDIGCGSGMQKIDNARLCPKAHSTAVDVYPAFLKELNKRVTAAWFSSRVMTVQASMDNLPFSPKFFDLNWAKRINFHFGCWTGYQVLEKIPEIRQFSRIYQKRPDSPVHLQMMYGLSGRKIIPQWKPLMI